MIYASAAVNWLKKKVNQFTAARSWHSDPGLRQAVDVGGNAMITYMKEFILTFIIIFCFGLSYGQVKISGQFIGFVPILRDHDSAKSTSRRYHNSKLTFRVDSVRLLMKPVVINATDTISSESEGGIYSYAGLVETGKGSTFINLVLVSCVNCPDQYTKFVPPKLVKDNGEVQASSQDTASLPKPPLLENPSVKYRKLLVEKTGDPNTLMVGGVIFTKRKSK